MYKLLIGVLVLLVPGCIASKGTNFWYEVPNPQTSVSVNPLTRSVNIYDNNGRGLAVEEASGQTAEGGSFTLKGLALTERSVENRAASVEQTVAVGQSVVNVATVWAPVVQNLIDSLTGLGKVISNDNRAIKEAQAAQDKKLAAIIAALAELRKASPAPAPEPEPEPESDPVHD